MGAQVELLDKFDRLLQSVLTSPEGRFGFAHLPVDRYSIRVLQTSYLPASRDRIDVKAGIDSMLTIHMATLLSSIEVRYLVPTVAMSNDWKWVLRTSGATRPITRLVASDGGKTERKSKVFSSTHAQIALTGGDTGTIDESDSLVPDPGASFVVSTNVYGKNQVQLSGTVGQGVGPAPSNFSFVGIYARQSDDSISNVPEVKFAVKQIQIRQANGSGEMAGAGSLSVRDVTMSSYQVLRLPGLNTEVEYGGSAESAAYLGYSTRVSPFARATVAPTKNTQLVMSYSGGRPPDELIAHQGRDETALGENAGIAPRPQLSYRDGRLQLQRTLSYEAGYKVKEHGRTYSASAFRETVSNGRLNVAGNTSELNQDDLLSDGISKTAALNIGSYRRHGYLVSADQRIGSSVGVAVAYANLTGFALNGNGIPDADGLGFLHQKGVDLAAVNFHAHAPKAGTRIDAGYGWADRRVIIPSHAYTTQNIDAGPGFNAVLHQPLPTITGWTGHFEIVVDAKNLLAEGYLPVNQGKGDKLLVVQSPRALRGGVNFIF